MQEQHYSRTQSVTPCATEPTSSPSSSIIAPCGASTMSTSFPYLHIFSTDADGRSSQVPSAPAITTRAPGETVPNVHRITHVTSRPEVSSSCSTCMRGLASGITSSLLHELRYLAGRELRCVLE